MSALRRIAAVARVEVLRLTRTPVALTLLVLVPAMQVLLFGYAIRPGGGALPVAIAAAAPADAMAVARQLASDQRLRVLPGVLKPGAAEAAVRARRATIGLEIPERPSFANPLAHPGPIRIVIDASDAALVTAAAPAIEAAYWRGLAEQNDVAENGPGYRIDQLYNPAGRTDWSFLPALIGVTMMISMIMLGTLSLARERETGSWEALLAMPVAASEVLAGKLLPYVIIGTGQGLLVLAAGVWLFDLPVRGNVAAFALLLPLFAAAHLVLGHAIAARAATQLSALQGAVAFYLPAMLLSGFLYPFETLPPWARALGSLFPLTHFIRASRGVMLRGAGASEVAAAAAPIAVFLAVALALGLILQQRRFE